jgi:hypothetical protein
VGALWTSGGVSLASVTFSNETAIGWQEQRFDSPVTISSNTTYVASYYSPSGYFSITPDYFGAGGYTNAPLRALTGVADGGNGVFGVGDATTFPATPSPNYANYWVDVVMEVEKKVDNTPPTISCPADVTLQGADCNTDPSNTGAATATDDSGGVNVTYSDSVSGEYPQVVKRTWTATDPAGNAASCVQTITCLRLPPSLVTDGSGCVFDCDPTPPVQHFSLLFMPDPHKQMFYRINDSNPGEFSYNVF